MAWKITLEGCDDHTPMYFEDLTEEEEKFLMKLIRTAAATSKYGCMPTISAYQIKEEDYQKYLKWKEIDDKCDSFDSEKITKEERNLHSQHYNEYWLERVAIKRYTPDTFKF